MKNKNYMQTLVFNTTERTAILYSDIHCPTLSSDLIYIFENVPTVKVSPDGFYEIIQEENSIKIKYPVLRVPITNTNMCIER